MMGLSASVFAILYTVTLRPHAISFMLVIVVALPVLCIISIPFFNAVPFRQKGELQTTGHFWSNSELLLSLHAILFCSVFIWTGYAGLSICTDRCVCHISIQTCIGRASFHVPPGHPLLTTISDIEPRPVQYCTGHTIWVLNSVTTCNFLHECLPFRDMKTCK